MEFALSNAKKCLFWSIKLTLNSVAYVSLRNYTFSQLDLFNLILLV